MSARSLIIGIDGVGLDLVEAMGPAMLPNLHRLMSEGAFAALESVLPSATLPNWATFLTGRNPGEHGVFDFTTRNGYRIAFTGGTVRAVPTFFSELDARGHVCAVIGFPGTWPPEQLQHGLFVSGWDSPVAFEADSSYVWPHAAFPELVKRFGPLTFDDADEFHADRGDFHDLLPGKLIARVEKRAALGASLLNDKEWDAFAIYFGETDTAAHHLWPFHDSASPRRPQALALEAPTRLELVYIAIDQAIAELIEAAGENAEITIVSDHGSGGSSDKVLHLNRVLGEAGLLAFRERTPRSSAARGLKNLALRHLPPVVRDRAFHAFDRALPGWLESKARFASIDMDRTLAFSDEVNYFPAIHLNVEGREPRGLVHPDKRESVSRQVDAALDALTDPWTGRRVVRKTWRREELYSGPHCERAPDLVIELELDRIQSVDARTNAGTSSSYSYNLMPSHDAGASFTRLRDADLLGRKGRSLAGSHRAFGIYVAHGPQVPRVGRTNMTIENAGKDAYARALGTRTPGHIEDRSVTTPLSGTPQKKNAQVERRLRALGYIE